MRAPGEAQHSVRRVSVNDDLKLWLPPADLTGGDKIRSFGVPMHPLGNPTSCLPYPYHLACRYVGEGRGCA